MPEFAAPPAPKVPRQWVGRPGGAGSAPVAVAGSKVAKSRLRRRRLIREAGWRALVRVLVGGTPEGEPRTDAGWFTPGTVAYGAGLRPPARLWWWPRLVRIAAVWVLVGVPVAVGYGWWRWPTVTPTVVVAVAAGVLFGAGWRHDRRLVQMRHWWRHVWPTHVAVHGLLGYPAHTPTRRYLDIPPSAFQPGGRLRVWLPVGWTGERNAREGLLAALREVLPLAEIQPVWHTTGRDHFLEIRTASPRLPRKIVCSPGVLHAIDAAPVDTKLLAFDAAGNGVGWDRKTEYPHAMFNAESGAGKSTLLSLYGAQVLRDGEILCVVDPKEFSLEFAVLLEDLHPNLHYWRAPGDVHSGLAWIVGEYDKRKAAALAAIKRRQPLPRFQPIVVLIDESNIMGRAQKKWWRQVRESHDPPSPPSVDNLLTLTQGGRQVRIHVLIVTQHGTAKGLGDQTGELRESFGTRILARSDLKAWGLVAPGIKNPPPKSDIRGRIWVVDGSKARECQVPYLTTDQLLQLATTPRPGSNAATAEAPGAPEVAGPDPTGIATDQTPVTAELVPHDNHNGNGDGGHHGDGGDGGDGQAGSAAGGEGDGAAVELVSLAHASSDRGVGLVDRSHAALKKARTRARAEGTGWFPAAVAVDGQAELYAVSELIAWDHGTHPQLRAQAPDTQGAPS